MKKLLACVLLMLYFFNLAGYPILFRYLIIQSTQQLTKRIENNNFSPSELIEIKIALNLPYIISHNDYQKYEGQVTVNGDHYSYVKRKVLNDTLYILCLPNKQKGILQSAQHNYTKSVSDFDTGPKGNDAVKKMNTLNQYYSFPPAEFSIITPQEITTTATIHPACMLPDFFPDRDGRPPQLNSHFS